MLPLLVLTLACVGSFRFQEAPQEPSQEGEWTLALAGDVMCNGITPKTDPLAAISPFLRGANLTIVNLEIPLTHAKWKTKRKTMDDIKKRHQYVLKADPKHIAHLKRAGIDAVSLGNNHAMDFRSAGLHEMTKLLDRAGIKWCGAGADEQAAFRPADLLMRKTTFAGEGGVRVEMVDEYPVSLTSILAFQTASGLWMCTPATESGAGVAALNLDKEIDEDDIARIEEIVANAGDGLKPFALHWGIENHTVPTSYQVALARAFIDAGADLIIGHHPHVLQGAEIYKGKPIFYSLGNLISLKQVPAGIFFLRYWGLEFQGVEMLPCMISKSKVAPSTGPMAVKMLGDFIELGRKFQLKYPHEDSQPMSIHLHKSANVGAKPPPTAAKPQIVN